MISRLTLKEIDKVLLENVLGRIACVEGDRPYIVPINYVYDGKSIIAHSVEGMKIRIMRKNPIICFEVDEMKSFTNWKSVIAWGRFQEITEDKERFDTMQLFLEKTMNLKVSETALPPEMSENRLHPRPGNTNPIVFKIILEEKSGRYETD